MKKIDWFIIKSYIGPFILTFLIAEFVLVLQFFFVYADDLMGKGLGVSVILELLFYTAVNLVPMSMPLAILLSSIMTLGNLGEKSELTAMKAAGMSIFRIMRPMVFFVMLLASISFYFSNNIWGKVSVMQRILVNDLTNKKLSFVLKDNIFFQEIDNLSIRANRVDKENNILYDVLIYEHQNNFNIKKIIRAEKGTMKKSDDGKFLVMSLFNGEINDFASLEADKSKKREEKIPFTKIFFDETMQKIDISSLSLTRTSEDDYVKQIHVLTLPQLAYTMDSVLREMDSTALSTVSYVENNFLPQRVVSKVSMDTLQSRKMVQLDDSLVSYYDEKRFLLNSKNRVKNAESYLERRREEKKGKLKHVSRIAIEWHKKFTLALACLVLFFIGAPLGSIVKKGGLGIPVVISIALFMIYYIISTSGEQMAKNLTVTPLMGMWLSTIVLSPVGILLTHLAAAEKSLFNPEFFSKIFSFFRKKKKS